MKGSPHPCGGVCAKSCQSCRTPCHPMDCSLPGSSVHGNSPGKSPGVGCHAFLQGIFLTQGSNPRPLHLLHCSGFLTGEPLGKLCPSGSQEQTASYFCLPVCMCVCCLFSRVQLFVTLWTLAHQAPLSMGFSRQEYWNGLPRPPPGDLPDPGIEPSSLLSPASAGGFFTTSATWKTSPGSSRK